MQNTNNRDARIWRMRHEGYMTPKEIARYYRLSVRRIYTILWRQNQARGLVSSTMRNHISISS